MSEQEVMTPEEARDLQEKLKGLAGELTSSQLKYLGQLMALGAESEEAQGYMFSGTALHPMGVFGAGGTSDTCTNTWCYSFVLGNCTVNITGHCDSCTCPPCMVA